MIDDVFLLTVSLLADLAHFLGTTYEGANVIVFYLLVPLVLCSMLDVLFEWLGAACTTTLVVLWAGFLLARGTYAEKASDLFQTSACLLRSLEPLGLSYEAASVLACLVAPAVTFAALVYLLRRKWRKLHGRT